MKEFLVFLVICMIITAANSAEFTCKPEFIVYNNCYIKNITDLTQHNEALTVVGQPSSYINSDMISLNIADNFVIRYVPTKIFSIFPNLKYFATFINSLTYLVTDAFVNCANLESIFIIKSNVKNIPAGFAQTCTNLLNIGITNGVLETVDADAFRGLSHLQVLQLSNNIITCIPATLLKPLINLERFEIRYNSITVLDPMIFKGLNRLSAIDFKDNRIQSLFKFDLTDVGIDTGVSIWLEYNEINAISPDFFTTTLSTVTKQLSISFNGPCAQDQTFYASTPAEFQTASTKLQNCYNNWQPSMVTQPTCPLSTTLAPITNAPTTLTTTTTTLSSLAPTTLAPKTLAPSTSGTCPSDKICRYFLDQYNRYTCILDGVDSLLTSIGGTHLITFDDLTVRRVVFTNSFLLRIPPILFQKFPNLEYLTASNCSMSSINTKTFGSTCGILKFFDASYNDITNVDGASFKSCTKIEVVDLTGNQFSLIDGQLFVNNPTLKSIYINRPPSMVLL